MPKMALEELSDLSREELELALSQAKQLLSKPSKATSYALPCLEALHALFGDILDELMLDTIQKTHREVWTCSSGSSYSGSSDTSRHNRSRCRHESHVDCNATCVQPEAEVEVRPLHSSKGQPDLWGQHSHPAKAVDIVDCRSCGRQVQAGSFAPHLEKCMGKGRVAARSRRL